MFSSRSPSSSSYVRQTSITILSRSRSSSSSSNSSRASIAVVPQNMNLKQLNELLLKYIDQVGRGQKHAKLSPPLFSTDHYRCGILNLDKTCKDPSQSTWTGRLRLLIARPPFGQEGIDKGMQSCILRLAAFINVCMRFVRIQMCVFSACINHVSFMLE